MAKYAVTFNVDGRFYVSVDANSPKEAAEKAWKMTNVDLGDIDDADFELSQIEEV